jgi:hypothetical protein
MKKQEQNKLIRELIHNVQDSIIEESDKYPELWDGIELRWRIADVFNQVVFSNAGSRKGKRYMDYKNTVIVENLI